ncbi:MAG: hypothetical protein IKB25_05285 [Lentisphaeria bacterium]|nr:hypothetical protein [Lentisphaeria bacterium]
MRQFLLSAAALFTAAHLFASDTSEFLKQERLARVSFDDKTGNDSCGYLKLVKTPKSQQFVYDGRGGSAWLASKNGNFQYTIPEQLMKKSGSVSFWIAPHSWLSRKEVSERGYLEFFRTTVGKGAFIAERQGFSGKRKDYFLTLMNKVMTPMPLVVSGSTEHWENGKWHLVAINWDDKSYSVSIDGGKFHSAKLSRPLTESDFTGKGSVSLNGGSVKESTLLDEFCIYKRNLTQLEAQQIYKNGLKMSVPEQKKTTAKGNSLNWDSSMVKNIASVPVNRSGKMPVIDGTINEKEWASAMKTTGAYTDSIRLDGRDYTGYVTSDGKKLYFAIRSELPPNGKLVTNHPFKNADNPGVGYDDSVEYWFAPDMGKAGKLYAGMLNFAGGYYDFIYDLNRKKLDSKWNSGMVSKSRKVNGEWHLEAAVPLSSFGNAVLKDGSTWGIRLIRNFKQPQKQADWSPVKGAFINTSTMGRIVWNNNAPMIRHVSLADSKNNGVQIAFEFMNPSKNVVSMKLKTFWENMGNTTNVREEQVTLNPGEKKNFTLVKKSSGGEYQVILQAESLDGKTCYYARKFQWNSRGKENAWTIVRSRSGADFKYGYYPYTKQLRTLLDISGYGNKNRVISSFVRVIGPDGKTVLEKAYPAFRNDSAEMLISVPVRNQGKYIVKAGVKDSLGKTEILEEGSFEHKDFSWAHNQLGISDNVIPPYTPLKRSGNNIESVLRNYQIGNDGLPQQVVSAGKKLLAAPVSFNISINGKPQKAVAEKTVQFTATKPHEIRYHADWKAGKMKGRTTAFFDYDGMLKLTLDFSLPPSEKLTNFDLVIPVSLDNAKLMHVLSDTGKASVTARVPKGKNPVWESMFIDHNSGLEVDGKVNRFPGTFVPYIWLGNEDRGICWFANNDRDWLPDDKQSVTLVNRYADRAEIVIRFVTRPSKLKRSRSITFALQATPTKPMPEKPANWRKITFGLPQIKGTYRAAVLGSAFHWGGEDYFSFAPRDEKVFPILREIRNGNFSKEKLESWIKGYNPKAPFLGTMTRSFRNGVYMVKSNPGTIIPYTNMRGLSVREKEFPVYKDEWLMGDYAPKKWREFDGAFGYSALTPKSRQDYILWCLNRMLDSGVIDGIYFDVTYPKASRNIVSGNAYYDDNGKLRTGCDLFESRELLKRCAVLTWQKRGYNLNMAHMSFTLIAPVHTWAGSILDWEARYGMSDFQTRFSREYIRTLSLGTQTGTVPVVLGSLGINGKGDRLHVQRTLIGMILTHEIKDWALGWGRNGLYEKIMRQLYEFGYGEPDCKVFRDWDDNFPVTIKGVDYSALALSGNGKMLLIICDYGNGGTAEVTLKPGTGLKGVFRCSDNTPVKTLKNDCSFVLPGNDFRILTIE